MFNKSNGLSQTRKTVAFMWFYFNITSFKNRFFLRKMFVRQLPDFLAGDVLKMLDEITEKPDFIVLDPPRDGIHPKALKKLIDYGVDKLLYISCKPTSLARDLVVLQAEGYKVEKVCCVDMFCNASHCETVCLLKKCKSVECN